MPTCDDAKAGPSAGSAKPSPLPNVDVWLVDGFNALHAVVLGGEDRGRFWEGSHRDRLIRRLACGVESGTSIDKSGIKYDMSMSGPVVAFRFFW